MQEWEDLLQWLNTHSTDTTKFKATLISDEEGNRSLIATEDIKEATPILSLPPSVLLNKSTLPKKFIQSCPNSLNSTRILTLFLASYRSNQTNKKFNTGASKQDEDELYKSFQPYLSSLPQEFPGIPLVWIIQSIFQSEFHDIFATHKSNLDHILHLLETNQFTKSNLLYYNFMTNTTIQKSNQVLNRFLLDWSNLYDVLLNLIPNLLLSDLVWAWLVVNTRCVWYDMGFPNHDDNITLAPAFDMANHSQINNTVTPIRTPHTFTLFSSHPIGTFNSPKTNQILKSSKKQIFFNNNNLKNENIQIKKDEEITFAYGPHSNSTLFVEYGFIVMPNSQSLESGSHSGFPSINSWDSIDISDQIKRLFKSIDNSSLKISMLQDHGYWGDYILQCDYSIEEAYRTIVALRLLHSKNKEEMRSWETCIEGTKNELNQENEIQVWKSLSAILIYSIKVNKNLIDRINHLLPNKTSLVPYSRLCLSVIALNEIFHLSSFLDQSNKLLSKLN